MSEAQRVLIEALESIETSRKKAAALWFLSFGLMGILYGFALLRGNQILYFGKFYSFKFVFFLIGIYIFSFLVYCVYLLFKAFRYKSLSDVSVRRTTSVFSAWVVTLDVFGILVTVVQTKYGPWNRLITCLVFFLAILLGLYSIAKNKMGFNFEIRYFGHTFSKAQFNLISSCEIDEQTNAAFFEAVDETSLMLAYHNDQVDSCVDIDLEKTSLRHISKRASNKKVPYFGEKNVLMRWFKVSDDLVAEYKFDGQHLVLQSFHEATSKS